MSAPHMGFVDKNLDRHIGKRVSFNDNFGKPLTGRVIGIDYRPIQGASDSDYLKITVETPLTQETKYDCRVFDRKPDEVNFLDNA